MARARTWTCPECGIVGMTKPESVPPTEFSEAMLEAMHQWARAFDRISAQQGDYTALDFMHWVIQNQRIHSHDPVRHEPAGRPASYRLEGRATAA